jgi:hypothetical protein
MIFLLINMSFLYIQVLKVRLCLRRTGEFPHWTDAVKRIYRFEGPKAFWRGYVLNQIGIVPYAGFDLACYEVNLSFFSCIFFYNFFYSFRV